ncbi:MAG: hypothetical protein LBM93_10945 [Oscillospiraceae bacterium]|jgi:hypothetical protein|nr:hypothetical protein [Oscillospiraceae bacterium]
MNENLIMAIERLSDEMIISRIPDVPDHIFSRKFEKRMKKIIAGTYTPKIYITPKKMTAKKFAVCLVAAILAILTFAMSVSAVRESVIKFFTQIFSTYTVVQSFKEETYPTSFEDFYTISGGIDGYDLTDRYETETEITHIYDNGERKIKFKQILKEYYDINLNTEGYDVLTIKVGDNDGMYVNMTEQNLEYLSFDNGSYVISFSVKNYNSQSCIGQNALIDIANSVQKVEN